LSAVFQRLSGRCSVTSPLLRLPGGALCHTSGHISVYSEPDKGATFTIYLPVSKNTHVTKEAHLNTDENMRGSETILLVEDDGEVRHLTHTILKRQGYAVLVAKDTSDALTILNSHEGPIQLLLAGVVMPNMSGKDLFLKAAEKRPQLKVLYMSGYTDNVIAHRGVLDEGILFIQKPFTVQGFAAKVREVLDQKVTTG
jgi:two-component system cell cycle sensor histidine kinase/response regulator CckA